jgi:hypothetical protein
LRDDEETHLVARHVLTNPHRAGLAENVEDYPYAGSLVCQLRELFEGVAKSG